MTCGANGEPQSAFASGTSDSCRRRHAGGTRSRRPRLPVERPGMFQQQHCHRIGFLARRARRHPDADDIFRPLSLEQLRDVRLQDLERLAIAKEIGHRDEQFRHQRRGLAGLRSQDGEVVEHVHDAADLHPARDAADDRSALAVAEIAPGTHSHEVEDVAQVRLADGGGRLLRRLRLRSVFGWKLELSLARAVVGDAQGHPPPAAPSRPFLTAVAGSPRWPLPGVVPGRPGRSA